MPPQKFGIFTGIAPILDPRNLDEKQGQEALNCDVVSGALVPIKRMSLVEQLDVTARSIFKDGDEWLSWITDVQVVRSPIFDERYSRIYYTGDGAPKVRGYAPDANGDPIVVNGKVVRDIGVARPPSAPTIAVSPRSTVGIYYRWYFYFESNGGMYQVTEINDADASTPWAANEYATAELYTNAKFKDYRFITFSGGSPFPAKATTTPADAIQMMYADAYSDSGKTQYLGRVYMNDSAFRSSSDLIFNGAKMYLRAAARGVNRNVQLSFQPSQSSDDQYTLDRYYVYTLVSDWGEEGPPSTPSALARTDPVNMVTVSGLTVGTATNIKYFRIYRTVSGNSGSVYKYVTQLPVATTSYSDTYYDSSLGEVMPSTYWEAPPAGMKGLCAMPGGFMAGFVDRTIYFSYPFQPHAWPSRYALTVEHDIVALAVSGNSLYVLTEQSPVVITGIDPAAMSQSVVPSNYACLSPRGVLVMNDNVIYSSTIGLVSLQSFSAVHLTKRLFSQEQWDALDPTSVFLVEHQNRIYMFHDKGGHIIYPMAAYIEHVDSPDITRSIAMVRTDIKVYAALNLFDTDTLYVTQGSNLFKWEGADDNLTMRWTSKEIYYDAPTAYTCCRISATAYPVTIRLLANSTEQVAEVVINDDISRRLPVVRREKAWAVSIEATGTVREVSVGNAIGDV